MKFLTNGQEFETRRSVEHLTNFPQRYIQENPIVLRQAYQQKINCVILPAGNKIGKNLYVNGCIKNAKESWSLAFLWDVPKKFYKERGSSGGPPRCKKLEPKTRNYPSKSS